MSISGYVERGRTQTLKPSRGLHCSRTSLLSSSFSGRAPTSGESEPAFGSEAGAGRTTCSVCSQLPRGKGWKSSQRRKSLTLPRNYPPPLFVQGFPRRGHHRSLLGWVEPTRHHHLDLKPNQPNDVLQPPSTLSIAFQTQTSRVKRGCTSHVDN